MLPRWLFHCLVCVFCLLVAASGLELDRRDLQLVQTFDKVAGDWRVALGSPPAPDQRTDIAVVLITEDSLLDYDARSPIDRALLAELVRAVDQAAPRAIVFDIIFDRRARADDTLIDAIARAKAPVVLAAIDERVRDVVWVADSRPLAPHSPSHAAVREPASATRLVEGGRAPCWSRDVGAQDRPPAQWQ
jgi:CHASE2 domain-containing sensor protein